LVDATNPDSRIGTGYFRGSGTSMSTALTSGVAADLLSARPTLSPDQVKGILTNSAYKTAALTDPLAAGHGGVNAAAAFTARPTTVSDSTGDWPAGQEQIWNSFSIALVRGDRAAAFFWWQKLTPAARSWVARSWTALSPAARSWVARSWVARSWVGADGTAGEWLARSWAARSWVARSWTGLLWDARSWTARSWTARSWTDDDWAARSWTARSWTARSWSTDRWS
jgi:serine protease AprX